MTDAVLGLVFFGMTIALGIIFIRIEDKKYIDAETKQQNLSLLEEVNRLRKDNAYLHNTINRYKQQEARRKVQQWD